ATPTTGRRGDPEFSSLGLVQAAVLGLTDPRFNRTSALQFIPNMDGFPNGRRLDDDVTRISLQAVSGIVLAAIGLPYDDYMQGGSLATPQLVNVLSYNTGINRNDTVGLAEFPYIQNPFPGNGPNTCRECDDNNQSAAPVVSIPRGQEAKELNLSAPDMMMSVQNPVAQSNTLRYHVATPSNVQIVVYDAAGQAVRVLVNKRHDAGTYSVDFNTNGLTNGTYMISGIKDGKKTRTLQVVKQ
ncbi:MAG: DUF4331 family protein, partial [Bacteroidota bacterium]|nr:DUF4331 family protein [Bacteroidota bacterium]